MNNDTSDIHEDSQLNQQINKFVDLKALRHESDALIRNILKQSVTGLVPNLGLFNSFLKDYTSDEFSEVIKIENRRLLTTTNSLVLPTML